MWQSKNNPITNKKDDAINQGYNSMDNLLYYSEELLRREIDECYNKSPIENNNNGNNDAKDLTIAITTPLSLTKSDILKLGVKELKHELRKQGHAVTGKKEDLIKCLQDAILNSVPVSEKCWDLTWVNEWIGYDCKKGGTHHWRKPSPRT